jgi:RHS repeat-associated protein
VRYLLGEGRLIAQTRGAATHYFISDAFGTTYALTNPNGNITNTYSAFGQTENTTTLNGAGNTDFLFTGQQFDDQTGLYHLRARQYDPSNGRFLARDTWAYDFQNPMELNRYVYAIGNPTFYFDPTGYMAENSLTFKRVLDKETVIIVGLIGIALSTVYVNLVYRFLQEVGAPAPPYAPSPPAESPSQDPAIDDPVVDGLDGLLGKLKPSTPISPNDRPQPLPYPLPWEKLVPDPIIERDLNTFKYVTYTLTNWKTQVVYTGRSRGTGSCQQIVMNRYAGHHKIAAGFGSPQLDKCQNATRGFATRILDRSYQAIRGREQQKIDYHGGSISDQGSSGNDIRGVAKANPMGRTYHVQSDQHFGNLASYTGY